MTPFAHVLLDLDGTLTDPAPGFVGCIKYALTSLGLPSPPDAQIAGHIGPPLEETLSTLLGPEAPGALPQAVRLYRERYSERGLYENAVYDGIENALETIVARGQPLYLATSKPHVFAQKILEHFELARFFHGVYGCQLDGTHADKRELLRFLIDQEQITPQHAVMVGDRMHDIRAARSSRTRSVGVLWGYGSETELREAGADSLISQPAQLAAAVAYPVR